jgi:hypothetical protein
VGAVRASAERQDELAGRIAFAKSISARAVPESVFISLRYGDHIVLYGERAVLLHTLIPAPERGRYREEEFEPGLTAVVAELLERGLPVYVVDDGASGSRDGLYDPVPVLVKHFTLIECPEASPPVFRVWPEQADGDSSTCWPAR